MNEQLIYKPNSSIALDAPQAIQQIRLGIQGFPGTGKTHSASTFPNPIYANFNRGLGALAGRPNILEVPFYKMYSRKVMKDKYVEWLETEGMKLTSSQTLVVDSLSDLHIYYHMWYADNEHSVALGRSGRINEFAEWQIKAKYFDELNNLYLNLKCNVVLICHESERPDKPTTVGQPGSYTGKIRPLITGQVGDVIIKDYTDWFRQHVAQKPSNYQDLKEESLANWGMKSWQEFKVMCETFSGPSIYYWQTTGDDLFNGKASSLNGVPKFIPATYEYFCKYQRQQMSK